MRRIVNSQCWQIQVVVSSFVACLKRFMTGIDETLKQQTPCVRLKSHLAEFRDHFNEIREDLPENLKAVLLSFKLPEINF
jgi:hypothetical protein